MTVSGDGPNATEEAGGEPGGFDFLVVANRLPVDQVELPDGSVEWRTSPGGLVTALEPVMRQADGAWVGWSGGAGGTSERFDAAGIHLVSVPLSAEEVEEYYEGFSNATLWPLYHDVIAAPQFDRAWWDAYQRVNARFASIAATHAGPGATVWVQDYQLQLVPDLLRRARPDLRIGFFDHIPFPGYEIFAQLPWRRQIVEGLLGADLVGFQRRGDAANFLRASRRAARRQTRGSRVRGETGPTDNARPEDEGRPTDAGAFPISIDYAGLDRLARQPGVLARAAEIRAELGHPEMVLLGVDRLDYTKGILHRLRAYGEILAEGRLGPPTAVLVQVASPSRERVEEYQHLRSEVEVIVGRLNGDHSSLGHPAIHYLHQSFDRTEMAALYLAADVMLVTPLRDGMNLVAKEYVASRPDEGGRLVLSEFTGAADELKQAFGVNPHDIDGMKATIVQAARATPAEARRRMRAMRRQVSEHDVHHWAATFLGALRAKPVNAHDAISEVEPGP